MALSQAEVLAGLKEIVEEVAGIPAASIEMDKNFTDDLDVDSLSMVEVVVAAEERFGVKIPDDQVSELATVGDAVNWGHISLAAAVILATSVPTNFAVPPVTASGRSVVSRSTKTGLPRLGASSWMPPESESSR